MIKLLLLTWLILAIIVSVVFGHFIAPKLKNGPVRGRKAHMSGADHVSTVYQEYRKQRSGSFDND